MKIAMTGATGFIGQHLVTALIKQGHDVTVLTRNISKAKKMAWSRDVRQIVAFDLNVAEENHATVLSTQDAILHLAWDGLPNYKESFHYEINLPATYKFLKTCVLAGVPQILVTGTCFEYGMQNGCLAETLNSYPQNAYSFAKDTLRKFLEMLRQQHPFTLQWARLFYMYGEGQNPNSLLAQLDKSIERGDTIFNMSGGEQLRDYLPVTEVASRLVRLTEIPQLDGITNICSGTPISVRRLVEQRIIERSARIKLNLGYYPYPSYEPMAFWGDTRKFHSFLSPQ